MQFVRVLVAEWGFVSCTSELRSFSLAALIDEGNGFHYISRHNAVRRPELLWLFAH